MNIDFANFASPLDPRHEHTEDDTRVFVFGSNLLGIHGGGAAYYAYDKLGADWGKGEGLMGNSYALPTCYRPGEPVTIEELAVYIDNFLDFASQHPELQFFVSKVGCGLAGMNEKTVAVIFNELGITDNCDMPPGWRYE
jgi:hypothetical protein